jgi:hypothetical protein
MGNDSKYSFEELVALRGQLQEFCSAHYNSLIFFRSGVSFKLHPSERKLGKGIHHLSSSATCIESLLDCPKKYRPNGSNSVRELAEEFAKLAIRIPADNWKSDGSARIYCRCRSLPLVVQNLPRYDPRLTQHLRFILGQLKKDPFRLAIGEASGSGKSKEEWYPPNSFHTYWTLELLHTIEGEYRDNFNSVRKLFRGTRFDILRIREELLVWSKQVAGIQLALHGSQSSSLDSDQLAWSLTTLMKFDRDFQASLAEQDFIRGGLKCLFEAQLNTGIWRTGAPLFHYEKAGNANCYVFETFATLLRSALTERPEGPFLRQMLRPYVSELIKLWQYAKSSMVPLSNDRKVIGWSSGHRVNQKEAESWATASVFSYSEYLRRLIGIWTREAATTDKLRVTPPVGSRAEAVRMLAERGDTWATDGESAAMQLMTLFVNPVLCFGSAKRLEPDSQPIRENQARSAILFGPPGTSKTTLAQCVANAIGWDYVELHAGHFVADGLPNVQRTANGLFERLMELDRTVILFDEIDELVRARDAERDAFGRFLTTSMLPKLADLWKGRRVIYFVATNHIQYFDTAVTRAQRFDALVSVSPPSFNRKLRRLKDLLRKHFIRAGKGDLSPKSVEAALKGIGRVTGDVNVQVPEPLPDACILAKLLLMRWDQLEELAYAIRKRNVGRRKLTLNRDLLVASLAELGDPTLKKCVIYNDYVNACTFEQHDFSKIKMWRVDGMRPGECVANSERGKDGCCYLPEEGLDSVISRRRRWIRVGPGVVKYGKR